MVTEYHCVSLLQAERKFTDPHACFYASSVMLAFEYLHDLNVICRDLKPEIILIAAASEGL